MDLILTNKRYLIVSAHTPISASNVPTTFSRPYPADVKLVLDKFFVAFCRKAPKTRYFRGADVKLMSSWAKIDVKLVSSCFYSSATLTVALHTQIGVFITLLPCRNAFLFFAITNSYRQNPPGISSFLSKLSHKPKCIILFLICAIA